MHMKITMEIDMSPEEVRKIMGLPDVEPMQKELMTKMQEKMNNHMRKGDKSKRTDSNKS